MKYKIIKSLLKPSAIKAAIKIIYLTRLSEPFLYNIVSLFVLIFGNYSQKIDYDLDLLRPEYCFGVKDAFETARKERKSKILLFEFGVASGRGFYKIAEIAEKLSKLYGIDYELIGFDTGKGLPTIYDYRDHPEKYRYGDYPSNGLEKVKLPKNCKIYFGEIKNTLNTFKNEFSKNKGKIAFVSIDVDIYSSTVDTLNLFKLDESKYLSKVTLHLDDMRDTDHNEYCGELLAVKEFNSLDIPRKICKMNQLASKRIFKNAPYLGRMFYVHIFDSEIREVSFWKNEKEISLRNPHIQ